MTVVMIYGFSGRYSGDSEYEWTTPEMGARHRCMLFLRQDSEAHDFQRATLECRRFGLTDIDDIRCGKLQIDALNTDLYRGFARFYEAALSEGKALLFYPNKERPDVA